MCRVSDRTFTAPLAFIRTTPPRLPRVGSNDSKFWLAIAAVRAIGETGLDFNRNYSPQPAQRAVFDAQLALAVRLQLPVFVHDRDSNGAVADALSRHRAALRDVVVHCFTGSEADLLRYLDLGCHIGITGWICDERRGSALKQLVARIPDDRLLIETDAPFLLPRTLSPRPKNRRNEPAYLIWVARAVAEARGQTVEAVGRANPRECASRVRARLSAQDTRRSTSSALNGQASSAPPSVATTGIEVP